VLAHPFLLLEELVQLTLLAGQLPLQVLAAGQEMPRILQGKGTGERSEVTGLLFRLVAFTASSL